MPTDLKYSNSVKNARMSALNTAIGASCKIQLYDGAKPAGPDTAITTQTKLAEWTGNAGGFGSVAGNVLTASAVASVTALANGTATWFRVTTSGGSAVFDGNAGLSGSTPDMVLSSTSITSGQTCTFNSLSITAGG
jgi:hypothetical protein